MPAAEFSTEIGAPTTCTTPTQRASLRAALNHVTIERASKEVAINMLMKTESQPVLAGSGPEVIPYARPSRARFALAFGIAAVSDLASLWTEFMPPVQWLIDLATAGLLFLILGRRWALLPRPSA